MQQSLSGLMMAAVVAIATLACSSGRSLQDEEQHVLAAEDEYVAAEIARDEVALRRLLDDGFVMNSSTGTTSDRDALIKSLLAMNMTGQTITERTVSVHGDVAVVFGTAEIRLAAADGGEQTSVLRYTSTYIRRGDQWRMLALHMSPRAPRQ